MSEVRLTILDWDRAITGTVHGSDADRAIGALAAEPETIEELDDAIRRFTDGQARSHFTNLHPGDEAEPHDAGVVIIDLAARLIAGESSYSGLATAGSIEHASTNELINIRLATDWEVYHRTEGWRAVAERRRAERAQRPQIDARKILYGRPMIEFIVASLLEKCADDPYDAIKSVHADWLTTARGDLGGKAPRDVMLERRDFITWDLQYREAQWSRSRGCPHPLDRETAAYRYAGFGTHEIVIYYDLVRFLLEECRGRLDDEGQVDRADEISRLERLCQGWLNTPDPEFGDRTPASVTDNERRRIPEACSGADAAIDPDCPCCQMMAEDSAPYFWHLDGCNMDDEFAFSFCDTREEWERERASWEEFNRKFEQEQALRSSESDSAPNVWQCSFTNDEILDDLPLSQFVPVVTFTFAGMIGEINQDILQLSPDAAADPSHQDTLNRLLGNLRVALEGSAELIDPALDRLVEELTDLGDRFPQIADKCADLSRRLQEFPVKLVASAENEDLPF